VLNLLYCIIYHRWWSSW